MPFTYRTSFKSLSFNFKEIKFIIPYILLVKPITFRVKIRSLKGL
ncbi:hypothetical protein MY4824_006216 [Beauveria thailandica]